MEITLKQLLDKVAERVKASEDERYLWGFDLARAFRLLQVYRTRTYTIADFEISYPNRVKDKVDGSMYIIRDPFDWQLKVL